MGATMKESAINGDVESSGTRQYKQDGKQQRPAANTTNTTESSGSFYFWVQILIAMLALISLGVAIWRIYEWRQRHCNVEGDHAIGGGGVTGGGSG
mmetsp:Transcript_1413/g.3489  ORF Transcript_1413/g.3489 Transcript_1413/m.3489 type:complete len:96 (-) Transcript_1413:435-722(-)|eukprot:CAMPEP_0119562080 /NCGR_PEP_ID=MMETSP1352-20130426/19464_1 /TAXON_ID=265584 /ORGANISM="Stauroneis constricta, Strain CCMP1120" /LENGTH=95 /DNA_ID=CAMNT_0007610425 /DNA_START=164 /DNA_END=451 /DNA_ORIENTATION=+